MPFLYIYITLTGFSLAVITNVSKAFGREDIEALRINFRMGLWLVLLFPYLVWFSKQTEEFLHI